MRPLFRAERAGAAMAFDMPVFSATRGTVMPPLTELLSDNATEKEAFRVRPQMRTILFAP